MKSDVFVLKPIYHFYDLLKLSNNHDYLLNLLY